MRTANRSRLSLTKTTLRSLSASPAAANDGATLFADGGTLFADGKTFFVGGVTF
jgi:hypothetical protein